MNILYYDDSLPKENLLKLVHHVQDKIGYDLVVVPKNFELFLDVSEKQLLAVRDMIDKALEEKQKGSC